ncbi:uncharacterized protein LOC108340379 isoform X2 [Vigna angularis]|uniref:uncharacterized protein LOC108340379 isoform X2 n=1 Tax=Phaseolus angularis TaxID=3914 RepID=UPI000809D35E|nr:uncharacterized protein LOC108340379 isoform X2 [Vigna angularis]
MHDLVRDVAHIIAKNENKMIKCEEQKDVIVEKNSIRYLWCVKFPKDLDCSNLEFLFLRTKMKELDGIFERMGVLKVLILVNDEDGKTPLSTVSFNTLTNLRDLLISNWELSDFSFLGGMKNLQSLSLFNCLLPSFPELKTSVAITPTTLKLLELNECDIKVKNFEVVKRIPLLEELYIIDIEGQWYANSEDNIEFFKTFSVPETLQRYGIVLGSRYFDGGNFKVFSSHHRTLLLNYFDVSNEVMKGLAKNAKDLFVSNIHGGAKSIIPDIFQIEGGCLNELNTLEIRDSEELECLIITSSHSSEVATLLSNLHTLKIDCMENLKAIWHCFLPVNGPFKNLEKLDLSVCPRLTSLFTYVVARSLVQLKILKISRCDELKHIVADDDKTGKGQDEFTTGHPVQVFQNLQEVEVYSCPELKHIFPANIVGGLTQLKVLEIKECDMLDQIISDIVPLTDQDRKEELDEILEEGTLSNLASLKITCCGNLDSIFTASIAKTLTSLEELYIHGCKSLKDIVTHKRVNKNQEEIIVEDEHDCQSDISIFQSLKKLHISECDLLEGIFPVSFVGELNDITNKEDADLKDFSSRNNTQIELPALQVLELDHIRDRIIVGSYNVICPSLRTLSLDIGRYVGFFNINCSTDASEATKRDFIAIKISNLDFVSPVESVEECLSKQPHGLNLIMIHNIREIELKGFDKARYLFKLSIASSLMLEILRITECDGLEYIIDTDDEYGKENMKAIFPNLKELYVYKCFRLKYMFGQYHEANKDYKEIHVQFSALEILSLHDLPNFVSICSTNTLTVTWPSLKNFHCYSCFYPFYGSINCLTIITSTKDPKGILNHFLTLQTLGIWSSGLECIFFLNGHEMTEQQVSLRLRYLSLEYLPQMTYIWVGPKNSFTLQHLTTLKIRGCGKLEVIFPSCVLRSLPELKSLTISECMELKQIVGCEKEESKNSFTFPNLKRLEIFGCPKLEVIFSKYVLRCLPELNLLQIRKCEKLKQIIEEDKKLSNHISPQPCFPKLEALYVGHCHKMKRLFSGSASNDLPNLHLLIINGAFELEDLVGCEQGNCDEIGNTKAELPKIKLLIFMHLSNFHLDTHLSNLKNCVVYNCPKLSFTSTTTLGKLIENFPYEEDFKNTVVERWEFEGIIRLLNEDSTMSGSSEFRSSQETGDIGNESIKAAAEGAKTKSLPNGVEDISIEGGVATHIESSGMDIPALDSNLVEQDDKMNEGKPGIVLSKGIQIEEGLNLLDKQEGIDIVSNNNSDISPDIRIRLGEYKHFVELDEGQISLLVEAIATYPHLWNACERFSERFQAWRLKILADMLLLLQKESGDNIIPQREKEFHKLCEEAIEVGFESSWVEEMRQRVVARDHKLGEDIAKRQIDENSKRSQAVEQGDGPNKDWEGTSTWKIQNVNSSLEEGSNLVDKEGEIGVVSKDRIVDPRNKEAEEEFALVNSQQTREPCMMNQKKPLGEISQSLEQVAVKETIAKNTNMAASSILSESASSQLDPKVTFQSKSIPHSEIKSSQIEAHIAKESEGHHKLIEDSGGNDMIPIALGKEGEDNLVLKTLVELEKYLKMSLKDIVSSETNTLRLFSTLNFLSNLPFKDVTLSDGLKHIIETMHQHFPTILCSFKQRFATIDKLAELEAHQNEVVIKTSKAENFNNEARLKEVVLKEQIIRLKEEIKVCEAALSSLDEGKNKCIVETIRYEKELENVRKNKSQMVEDQRKVEQELFEVTYKWSILCSEYELNRMAVRSPS